MSNYSGVPTIEVETAIEIAELCMVAGRPDRIAEFLGSRLTPGEVKARLTEAAAKTTAAANTTASPSAFGPTPQQADALAAAIQRRFEQVYPKRGQ